MAPPVSAPPSNPGFPGLLTKSWEVPGSGESLRVGKGVREMGRGRAHLGSHSFSGPRFSSPQEVLHSPLTHLVGADGQDRHRWGQPLGQSSRRASSMLSGAGGEEWCVKAGVCRSADAAAPSWASGHSPAGTHSPGCPLGAPELLTLATSHRATGPRGQCGERTACDP